MNKEIDNWLTRFAAGAGSNYEWRLIGGAIRAYVSNEIEMCPISAQATLETGKIFEANDWSHAGLEQGFLGNSQFAKIIYAADGFMSNRVEIRERLLRICGLEEQHTE